MNSFNGFANSIRNVGYYVVNYIYNFPLIDPSLVLYYPLDSSGSNSSVANYASGLPVYDASLSVGTTITTSNDSFVSGLGDLSLNNTMGSVATQYVTSNKSFTLVPSAGLSISVWFSCSGELGKTGTMISLYQDSNYPSIELDILGSTLFSGYSISPFASATDYFPFTTDHDNKIVGGTISIFTSNMTFKNLGGKPCTNFNSDGYMTSNSNIGSVDIEPPITICFWYYMEYILGTKEAVPFGIGNLANGRSAITMVLRKSNNMITHLFKSGVFHNTNITSTLTWIHVCYTISSTNLNIYINGVLNKTISLTSLPWDAFSDFRYVWGRYSGNISNAQMYGTDGGIRHFTKFNKVLTQSEVSNIYNATL